MLNNSSEWSSSRRERKEILEGKKVFFLYCGEETEPNYFRYYLGKLVDFWNQQSEGLTHFSYDDLSYPKSPKEMVMQAKRQIEKDQYDEVYVVFDKDDYPINEFNDAVKQIASMSSNDLHCYALWSNQCLELWFILCFELLQTSLPRNRYFKRLRELLGRPYEKNIVNIAEAIEESGGSIKAGLKNAEKLHKANKRCPSFAKRDPDTAVDAFFLNYKEYLVGK
ncbi:MAG: RloB family protein [Bacilli bacterium]|nr:RloB family protein [Bacilli bacterium]